MSRNIAEENKSGLTEIVFIIDKSGSMQGFEADTVGGFNATLENQKAEAGDAYVSTVFFSNGYELIHDRVPIREVEPLTRKDYRVGGCTALMDAVGDMITHISNIHKYARPEDVPKNTIFVITTDGMENASRKYTTSAIKKMIKQKQKECGWEFIFMAANIDAFGAASDIGISNSRAAAYLQTEEGFAMCFRKIDNAVRAARRGKISEGWCEEEIDR